MYGRYLCTLGHPYCRDAAPRAWRHGLASIHATTSGMRARAFAKYPTLRTLVAPLSLLATESGASFTARGAHWTKTTNSWLTKCIGGDQAVLDALAAAMGRDDAKDYGYIVRTHIDNAEWAKLTNDKTDKNHGAKWYNARSFLTTRTFIHTYTSMKTFDADLDRGVAGLIACRTYGLWTGDRAARLGMIDARYKTRCPCCDCDDFAVPETLAHLLLHCPAWTAARATHLRALLNFIAARAPGLSDDDTVTVLLGGIASTNFTLGDRWHTKASRCSRALPLFLRVARFLAAISARRATLLWRSSKSRGPTEDMAALGGTEA